MHTVRSMDVLSGSAVAAPDRWRRTVGSSTARRRGCASARGSVTTPWARSAGRTLPKAHSDFPHHAGGKQNNYFRSHTVRQNRTAGHSGSWSYSTVVQRRRINEVARTADALDKTGRRVSEKVLVEAREVPGSTPGTRRIGGRCGSFRYVVW